MAAPNAPPAAQVDVHVALDEEAATATMGSLPSVSTNTSVAQVFTLRSASCALRRIGSSDSVQRIASVVTVVGEGRLGITLNLLLAVLGAGVLSMPYAFELAGWCTIGITIVLGAVAAFSSSLLGDCVDRAAVLVPGAAQAGMELDWPLIGLAAFGRWGRAAVDAAFTVEVFTCLLSLMVLTGSCLSLLFPDVSRPLLMVGAGVVGFLSMLLPPQFTTCFSFLGVVCNFMILATVLMAGLALPPDTQKMRSHKTVDISGILPASGIVFFCLAAHSVIPSIYSNLSRAEKKSFRVASVQSFGLAVVHVLSCGAAGYLFFGNRLHKSVAENVGRDLLGHEIPRVRMLQLMLAGLLVAGLQPKCPQNAAPLISNLAHWLGCTSGLPLLMLKATFMAFATASAICLRDQLDIVNALVGSLCASCLAAIFPTAFYLKLYWGEVPRGKQLLLGTVCAAGVFLMVAGTADGVVRLVRAATHSGGP